MKILKNIKHIFAIISLSLILLFTCILWLFSDFLTPINYFFTYRTQINATSQDLIYKHKSQASNNIVIVEIDEKTLNHYNSQQELSTLTIGKDQYAQVVKNLTAWGAKAIAFDIIFQNKDDNDHAFIQAMKDHGNVVIGTTTPNNEASESCVPDAENANIVTCSNTPRSNYGEIDWWYIQLWSNHDPKSIYAHQGGRSTKESSDTTSYRVLWYNLTTYPHQFKAKFGNNMAEIKKNDANIYTLPLALIKNENIPAAQKFLQTNINEKVLQPYFTGNREDIRYPYEKISFVDIAKISDEDRESMDFSPIFSGAYVFVGESGTHLHDNIISPAIDLKIPGVYSHAFFLDGMLQDKMLSKMNPDTSFLLFAGLTIIFTIFYFFAPKFISPIVAILSIPIIIFICRYSYDQWRLLIDIFPLFLATSIITYPITYIYKFFIIERDKRLITNAFSRYLSPSVVNMIDENKIDVTLGGEKKELSILFSDIAGFTSISEKMDTKELFVIMTKYLSTMTEVLINQKWTLDKYIGDAIMGFFGAPVDDSFHAKNACQTALDMRKKLQNFNAWLKENGHESIDFRVGIATGEVMVGNIGSEKQFNYTVLGDTVNLASRLEATGKEYGVNIIIAANTRMSIGDEFLVRELDYIAVKGKNEGVRIYELIWHQNDAIEMQKYHIYEQALQLYRENKFLEAGRLWESIAPQDAASNIMMHRCIALIKGEMKLDNGIYRMTHK